ncbi:hypothetical protein ACTWP5_14510 [Streptomyces sp. 4N509B]|uniref:hypothetical protein n=1 Tax=Streptomyces sp. 4N509B TaxID=3457413 RepID=UPI003FD1C46A
MTQGTPGTPGTTATGGSGVPAAYGLRFPASWWNLDLNPNTRDAAIRRRILSDLGGEAALTSAPADARAGLESLIRAARRSAREAHARGALQLAGMFDLLEDGSVLIGNVMVLCVNLPEGTTPDLSELMLAYAVQGARNPLGQGTRARRNEIIELPHVGPAGRATSVEDIDFYGRGWARVAISQTVVPVPGTHSLLVVAGTTPNLTLVDAFFDMFDAIAGTLTFTPHQAQAEQAA